MPFLSWSLAPAIARHVLHGARRARGTSLCPGHILLFGHVKILILSLLSKSLPVKGREARPAAKAKGGLARTHVLCCALKGSWRGVGERFFSAADES